MFACAEVPELLRVRPAGKDPTHPLGTSPERQMSPPGLPVLGCSAGHACCPWTMPLCGRPEPSASAWVTSAAASCLSAPALTGVSKHDCASIGMAHHGTHGSLQSCPQCAQPPLRFPRASLSWPHSSPASRPLCCVLFLECLVHLLATLPWPVWATEQGKPLESNTHGSVTAPGLGSCAVWLGKWLLPSEHVSSIEKCDSIVLRVKCLEHLRIQ